MKFLDLQRDTFVDFGHGGLVDTFKTLPRHNADIINLAAETAKKWHEAVNHKYDGKSYFEAHIEPVVAFGHFYLDYIPKKYQGVVIASLYLHDSVEDTMKTYRDVYDVFYKNYGEEVATMIADIVFACTNDKGKTRKERAGKKYYKGIRNTPYATFVKIMDRLGNGNYSKKAGSTMFKKYKQENADFVSALKGTNTILGTIKYFLNKLFKREELDYTYLYHALEILFISEPIDYKLNYQEI